MNICLVNSHRSVRRGFSVAELLVCVGLLSLFVSMTMPTLLRARERSRQSLCASNQRQIGLATVAYAAEYFDVVPREGISPYVRGAPQDGFVFVPWAHAVQPYLATSFPDGLPIADVFRDPSYPNPNHLINYVSNGFAFGQRPDGSTDFEYSDRRPATPHSWIQRPSSFLFLTEFTDDPDNSIYLNVGCHNISASAGVYDVWRGSHLSSRDFGSNHAATNVRRIGPRRHGELSNALFGDGHIEALTENMLRDPANWDDGRPLRSLLRHIDR